MALDPAQFYKDPNTGTTYTSYATYAQNVLGTKVPGNINSFGQLDSPTQQQPTTGQANLPFQQPAAPVYNLPPINPSAGLVPASQGQTQNQQAANQGFTQVKLDNKGTYGGYNPATGQAIAFSDPASLHQYFANFDPNAQMATFDTKGILGNPNQVMSLQQAGGNVPLNVGGTAPAGNGAAGNPDAMVAGVKSFADNMKDVTPPTKTDAQIKSDQMSGELSGLYGQTAGKIAAEDAAETAAGVPQNKMALAEINAQILSRVAAYEATYQQAENQSIPMNLIIGQQAQIKKAEASEIGMLQARALGLQGMITAAVDAAHKAVDLKYSAIDEAIAIKEKQLALLAPQLSTDEKRQAAALQLGLDQQKEALETLKTKIKANLEIILKNNVTTPFANLNGEFMDRNGKPYSTPEEFFKDAGVKSFEEAYAKNLVSDVKPTTDYSKLPTSYQEYILAKNEGYKGTYNDYQTMDANRKAVRSTTNISYGQGQDVNQKNDQQKIAAWLDAHQGADKHVSPSDYATAKNSWVQDKHSSADFDNIFSAWVDPSHPQDYSVKWKATSAAEFQAILQQFQ